ncbi:MAG TPA: hypothetical protein VJ161_11025, partial [Geobacteraceae bacterium]|nr:hypothetical protein [Geobacteraceae bacterium]
MAKRISGVKRKKPEKRAFSLFLGLPGPHGSGQRSTLQNSYLGAGVKLASPSGVHGDRAILHLHEIYLSFSLNRFLSKSEKSIFCHRHTRTESGQDLKHGFRIVSFGLCVSVAE